MSSFFPPLYTMSKCSVAASEYGVVRFIHAHVVRGSKLRATESMSFSSGTVSPTEHSPRRVQLAQIVPQSIRTEDDDVAVLEVEFRAHRIARLVARVVMSELKRTSEIVFLRRARAPAPFPAAA